MAEEAMEPGPVPVADVAAGEDDCGDEAVPLREDPAGDDGDEGLVGGAVKTGENCGSRSTNEEVSSMGRFPCLGAFEAQKPRQVAKKWQGNRHVFSISNPPSKVRNGNSDHRVPREPATRVRRHGHGDGPE